MKLSVLAPQTLHRHKSSVVLAVVASSTMSISRRGRGSRGFRRELAAGQFCYVRLESLARLSVGHAPPSRSTAKHSKTNIVCCYGMSIGRGRTSLVTRGCTWWHMKLKEHPQVVVTGLVPVCVPR
eukprot:3684377-Amphidinium_carterae.2